MNISVSSSGPCAANGRLLVITEIDSQTMKTIFEILFWPLRTAWGALVFLLKLVLIVCTFGLITMIDS